MKLKINTDGYVKRAVVRARKLDWQERIKPEIAITFDNPLAMLEVLSAERIRLCAKGENKALFNLGPSRRLGARPQSCAPGRAEIGAGRGCTNERTD